MTDSLIYKIVDADAWAAARAAGRFDGAGIDLADGYIHLSARDQVAETARLHFAGREGLLLVAVDPARLGDALKWEESRGGALFPHLHGALTMDAVAWERPMPLGPDGAPAPPLDDPDGPGASGAG